jgi:cyclohexanone monooxygenase
MIQVVATQNGSSSSTSRERVRPIDVLVVGAGFAGLYMLHKLRSLGFQAQVLEAGSGVGGTWYWNRYPGARCDIESLLYSYSFSDAIEKKWTWSERYAPQAEILRYLEFVADELKLKDGIRLNSRVRAADYSSETNRWTLTLEDGSTYSAPYCVMATGCLSIRNLPKFEGLERYKGKTYHTGDWPHEGVDFAGTRVAVIGTGSSGIQSIPVIAQQAASVTVFQRTANFSVPARNRALTANDISSFTARTDIRQRARLGEVNGNGDLHVTDEQRAAIPASSFAVPPEQRQAVHEFSWEHGGVRLLTTFKDLLFDEAANEVVAEFVRGKIRTLVKNPDIADDLTPKGYPIGSKRLCVDTDYYSTFNRDNVTLINLRKTPLVSITEKGIRTTDREFEFDIIVFATGFDAMTGALLQVDIRSDGRSLRECWADGPTAYLGVAVAGFPNLFTITGPGSPAVLSNVVISIEQHVEWIADCLKYLRKQGAVRIEADPEAERQWMRHVKEVAEQTIFVKGDNWLLGSNIPGKPRQFLVYVGPAQYRLIANEIAAAGYRGFKVASMINAASNGRAGGVAHELPR